MFMRQFGHGVGHWQYRQQEVETVTEMEANLEGNDIDIEEINEQENIDKDEESEGEEELASEKSDEDGSDDECNSNDSDLGYVSF
jgi:hypothetical protein